jgi:hypothetical protein
MVFRSAAQRKKYFAMAKMRNGLYKPFAAATTETGLNKATGKYARTHHGEVVYVKRVYGVRV